ncbi:MAG: hypothetical protein ABSH19_08335 [Opitutales bacterium]
MINTLARLGAAGLVLGLLSAAPQAQAQVPIFEGNLSPSLQGYYNVTSLLYYVAGRQQTTGNMSIADKTATVTPSGVFIGSEGLIGANYTALAELAGLRADVEFSPSNTTTETSSSGTISGELLTNQGILDISKSSYTATLNAGGLRFIASLYGTLETLPEPQPIANALVKRPLPLTHAAINILYQLPKKTKTN